MELRDVKLEDLPLDELPALKDLNDRQRNFAVFYVSNGGNGADAARRAGYAEKTASKVGGQMAKSPRIRAAVLAVREWFFARMVLTKNEALALLSEYARGSLGDMLDESGTLNASAVKRHGRVVESYDEQQTMTEGGNSVRRRVKLRDPRAAIETLGKVLGWFKDDVSIKTDNVKITMVGMKE